MQQQIFIHCRIKQFFCKNFQVIDIDPTMGDLSAWDVDRTASACVSKMRDAVRQDMYTVLKVGAGALLGVGASYVVYRIYGLQKRLNEIETDRDATAQKQVAM